MTAWIGSPSAIASQADLSDVVVCTPVSPESIMNNAVHVWFAEFEHSTLPVEIFTRHLDAAETSKMSRFVFKHLRDQYAYAHGLLRSLLSRYVGCQPGELQFIEGAFGKPALLNAGGLSFSLSHSGHGVAIAIARDLEVGIDIEQIKQMRDRSELVAMFFSADEITRYRALPDSAQEEAFFKLWTRKEAFLKGLGLGLSHPLNAFSVGLDFPVTLTGHAAGSWTLHHLELSKGFVGAIALHRPQESVSARIRQFSLTILN